MSRTRPHELCQIQMDHEQEMRAMLGEWAVARQEMAAPPTSWHDGVDRDALLHLLFGVVPDEKYGEPFLRPRCRGCHVGMPHGREKLPFVCPSVD